MLPIIRYYTESGIIPLSDVRALDQEALMEKILKDIHHYKISKTKDGRWSTYIPDQTKPYGRRHVKKRSQAELNKFLLGFYKICDGASLMSFGELYAEWMAYKKQFVGASNRKRRRTVSSLLNTVLPQKAVAEMLGHTERVNEQHYNYSMAENAEKKRALEKVFSNVFNFSDYIPEEKRREVPELKDFPTS